MTISENNSIKLQLPVQESSETTKLLPRSNQDVNLVEPSKKCQLQKLLIILLLIFTGMGLVAYISHNTTKLTVLNFNVWGMPGEIDGCKYKPERMEALADLIKSRTPYFDLFLLTELWMQADHQLLEDAANSVGLHMTGFRQLSSGTCDGLVLTTECSGLAIISTYPLKEVEFHQFTLKGKIWDGEALQGKGVGRVRIELARPNATVDVFVTHTIADGKKMANETWYRVKQVEELVDRFLKKSTADVIILGGDFNTPPILKPGEPYNMIHQFMNNACEAFTGSRFHPFRECLAPNFATYGNQRNSFSYMYDPLIQDYIFYKRIHSGISTFAFGFELPSFQTNIIQNQKEVSITLSDHEPLISTIYLPNWWPF